MFARDLAGPVACRSHRDARAWLQVDRLGRRSTFKASAALTVVPSEKMGRLQPCSLNAEGGAQWSG